MRLFEKKYLNTTKRTVTHDTNRMVDYINTLEFDALICGSDEIWRSGSAEISPPSIFFLPKELSALRFAFAPSANGGYKFTQCELEWLKETFHGYKAIYARDAAAQKLVHDALGVLPPLTFDPTVFYDFAEFRDIRMETLPQNGRKKICFMFNDNIQWLADSIRQMFPIEACDFYSLYQSYKGTKFLPLSPEEFTTAFNNFDLVFTNMFHGTIFSLRNNAWFISIDTQDKYADSISKIEDLLTRMKLETYHFSIAGGNRDALSEINTLASRLIKETNKPNYDNKLKEARNLMKGQVLDICETIRNLKKG